MLNRCVLQKANAKVAWMGNEIMLGLNVVFLLNILH